MILQGKPRGWATTAVDLILNGQSLGSVHGRWFSEGMDLDLHGHKVRFERVSWLRSHFVLKDADDHELVSAMASGMFTTSWDMHLRSGAGILRRAGWMTAGFVLEQGSLTTAQINLTGWFTREWELVAADSLAPEDALLIAWST